MLIGDLNAVFANTVSPQRRSFETNEIVFRAGDPVLGIYAIEEGQIKLERYTAEGRAAVVFMTEAKASFAEAALFSATYHCYAIATRPTRLILFPKEGVLKALHENPQTALQYIALLSAQVRTLRTSLELRSILSARERILQHLLYCMNHDTSTVSLSGTLKDLAAHLGLAHETFYRELSRLERDGIIERGDNSIRVRHTL